MLSLSRGGGKDRVVPETLAARAVEEALAAERKARQLLRVRAAELAAWVRQFEEIAVPIQEERS